MSHHPTFYGTSLDQALWKAATALEREPSSLEYRTERLEDGQVKVEVVDEPKRKGTAPDPEPLEEPIRSAEDEKKDVPKEVRIPAGDVPAVPDGLEPDALAVTVLKELLKRVDTEAKIDCKIVDDTIRIELSDCDEDLLLGRDARVLDSFQYLVTRIVQHKERGGPSVFLDVRGQRENRAKRMTAMALRLADKVHQLGTPIAVEAATNADRRIIHNALSDRKDVRTESEGAGAFRHLVVHPAGK